MHVVEVEECGEVNNKTPQPEVLPLAAACIKGIEPALRDWLAYETLMTEKLYSLRYVDWCMQAAMRRKNVDDHIAMQLAALGPRAPTRIEIVYAMREAVIRLIPVAAIIADDLLRQ